MATLECNDPAANSKAEKIAVNKFQDLLSAGGCKWLNTGEIVVSLRSLGVTVDATKKALMDLSRKGAVEYMGLLVRYVPKDERNGR